MITKQDDLSGKENGRVENKLKINIQNHLYLRNNMYLCPRLS